MVVVSKAKGKRCPFITSVTRLMQPCQQLRDLAKVAEIEKRRTTLMLDSTRASSSGQTPRSGDPTESSSERFPRDVRSSFDEEAGSSPGRTTALKSHHAVRTRPLTGISEGDENRLSNAQQGFVPGLSQGGAEALPRATHQLAHLNDPFDDRQSIATDQLSFASSTNVIPIAFVPSQPTPLAGAGPSVARGGTTPSAQTALEAAREKALKTGRLKVGIAAPPSRPARSPDLDLRLHPNNKARSDTNIVETLASADGNSHDHNAYRLSVNTTKSVAPSFFSGTSEFAATGMDAPMIMTSKQVQLGIRQAAEVVHISPSTGTGSGFPSASAQYLTVQGAAGGYEDDAASPTPRTSGPFLAGRPDSTTSSSAPHADDPFADAHNLANGSVTHRLQPQRSTATFGGAREHHLSHQSSAFASDDGRSAVSASVAGGGGGDLRFSMSSLAESKHRDRDSVSTQGTGALRDVVVGEARKINLGGAIGARPPTAWQMRSATNFVGTGREDDDSAPLARPQPGFAGTEQYGEQSGARESMLSGRSDDSFLNAIIPPKFTASQTDSPSKTPYSSSGLAQKLPTSMSTETFSSAALFAGASPGKRQPAPQVQSPSRNVGQNPLASESRHTLGLSGFEFQIGDDEERDAAYEELPPLPMQVSRS